MPSSISDQERAAKPLEQSPQQVSSCQRDHNERGADGQMLAKRGIKAEPREHNDLRDHSEAVANRDIRHCFDQRHEAGLGHASNPKRLKA